MATSNHLECFFCNTALEFPATATDSNSNESLDHARQEHSRTLIRLFSFLHQYSQDQDHDPNVGPTSVVRKTISNPELLKELGQKLEAVDFCKKCIHPMSKLVRTFKVYDKAGHKLERLKDEVVVKLRTARGGTWDDSPNYELTSKIIEGFAEELSLAPTSPVGLMTQAPSLTQPRVQPFSRTPVIKLHRAENIPALAKLMSKEIKVEPVILIKIKEEPVDLEVCPEIGDMGLNNNHPSNFSESHEFVEPDLPDFPSDHSGSEYEPDPPSPKKRKTSPRRKVKRTARAKLEVKVRGSSRSGPGRPRSKAMTQVKQSWISKARPHICDFEDCNQQFGTAKALQEHVIKVHGGAERPWRCDQPGCATQFFKQSSLTHHIHFAHSTTYRYPCPKCLKGFARYNEFVAHQHQQHGDVIGLTGKSLRPYDRPDRRSGLPPREHDRKRTPMRVYKPVFPCEHEGCEFRARSEWETQDHFLDTHPNTERPYNCSECEARFIREERLARHKHWSHSTFRYPCQDCDFACNQVEKLERHRVRAHKEGKRCPYPECDYVGTKVGLQQHLESSVHETAQRNHVCQHCGEACATPQRLKYHINSRHPDLVSDPEQLKLYRCEQCGKMLSSPPGLRTHIRTVHNREEGEIHCEKCGRNFLTMSRLRAHMRYHLNPEDFAHECQVCHAKFRNPTSLNTHMRRHTGDFKDVCKECGKKFTNSGALKRHERIHAGVLKYVCHICNKGFPIQGYLTTHMKSHMSKEERAELKKRKPEAPPLQKIYHDLWRKRSTVASVAADPLATEPIEVPEYPMHFNYDRQRNQISRVLTPEEIGGGEPPKAADEEF